jgi:subfamily B ATP-binding cassette protein MsbA
MNRLKNVLPYLLPFKRQIFIALSLTALLTLVGLLPPLVYMELVDRVLTQGQWRWLIPVVGVTVLLPIMSSTISFFNTMVIAYMGWRMVFDVRTQMYRHLLRLSMRFHGEMSSGAVMSRLMSDVNAVQSLITGTTITLVTDVISVIFAIVMVFSLNWMMASAVFVMLPLYLLNYAYFTKRIRRSNIRFRRTMDRVAGTLQERLSGTKLVRQFQREEDEAAQFLKDTEESLVYSMQRSVQSVSFSTASHLVYGLGTALIFGAGLWFVLHGEMTYGSVTAFMAYMGQLFSPAIRFTGLANQIEQVMVSVDRILEIVNTEPEIVQKPDAFNAPRFEGAMSFEHVVFGYNENEPVIKDVSLEIEAGATVAFVGHTGCGKTTMTSLAMRLWEVSSGAIRIDGQDIRDLTLRSLRQHMGVVLQDPILFHMSLADNIRYGMRDATMEQVVAAGKMAEIHQLATSYPDAYDTMVGGDDGVKLSVGEKQRMAIARAIITDPSILIMDEATSSLDSESELLIQEALGKVMVGRTSLVIAHRLSTIVSADTIVVMDAGKIIEQGPHDELLAKGGHYAALHSHQTSGREAA